MAQPRIFQTFYSRSKTSVCTSVHHDLATRSTTAERAAIAAVKRVLSGEFGACKIYNTETAQMVFHLRGSPSYVEVMRKTRKKT